MASFTVTEKAIGVEQEEHNHKKGSNSLDSTWNRVWNSGDIYKYRVATGGICNSLIHLPSN